MQSPFYGVFSSNRPELSLPYFAQLSAAVPLGQRRAAATPWGAGVAGTQGLEVDDWGVGNWGGPAMPGGYGGIELPGHIGPFGIHGWTDRGQRSNAALSATTFIDYVE